MNSRRHLLQFLGLGSLFATAAVVTPNQSRAASGMGPLPEIPEWARPEFPPYTRTKWQHRVIKITLINQPEWPQKTSFVILAEILDRETQNGWEFVSMGEGLTREIVFRKRVLWSA